MTAAQSDTLDNLDVRGVIFPQIPQDAHQDARIKLKMNTGRGTMRLEVEKDVTGPQTRISLI